MRLKQSKFKSWLKAKPPTEIIGFNRDCTTCPIANFHSDASGCEVVIFDNGYGGYTIDRGYDKRRMPIWAATFVSMVDGEVDPHISAGRALEILGQISP